MSEVAAVAAITGGTSILTSAITAAVTWSVSKNSASVELQKIRAENDRLQQGNREGERRNRQATYHQFLDVLNAIYQTLGTEITEDHRHEVCAEYNHLLSGVMLFGPSSVRDGAYAVNAVYRQIWPALGEEEVDEQKSHEECWCNATSPLKDAFGKASGELVHLLHSDVTRGITEDPDEHSTQ